MNNLKILSWSRYISLFFILLGSGSFVFSQTIDEDEEYIQLEKAKRYINSMNAKLESELKKAKNFNQIMANLESIQKSDSEKRASMIKEFQTKYGEQMNQIKKTVNYDEYAIVSKVTDMLKVTSFKVAYDRGYFSISKTGIVEGIVPLRLPNCIEYDNDNFTLTAYQGPPDMGIRTLFIDTDPIDYDFSGSETRGNKLIQSITVTNGILGNGRGKLLKIKIPSNYTCGDLKISANFKVKTNIFGFFIFGPASETLARVKVTRSPLRTNLISNRESALHILWFNMPFGPCFSTLNNQGPSSLEFDLENREHTSSISESIRVRPGQELEVLFEAAALVECEFGPPLTASASITNISVELCKCE